MLYRTSVIEVEADSEADALVKLSRGFGIAADATLTDEHPTAPGYTEMLTAAAFDTAGLDPADFTIEEG